VATEYEKMTTEGAVPEEVVLLKISVRDSGMGVPPEKHVRRIRTWVENW
jgi:hypothetical protein